MLAIIQYMETLNNLILNVIVLGVVVVVVLVVVGVVVVVDVVVEFAVDVVDVVVEVVVDVVDEVSLFVSTKFEIGRAAAIELYIQISNIKF